MQNALDSLITALESGGVSAGLAFLNARVAHRYTAIVQLQSDVLRPLWFHDKRGQGLPPVLQAIPFEDSFCQFALADAGFATTDAMQETRLDGHKHQCAMTSYVGIPLIHNDGTLFGTFCHMDSTSCDIPADEFEFLKRVARVLPKYISIELQANPPIGHLP